MGEKGPAAKAHDAAKKAASKEAEAVEAEKQSKKRPGWREESLKRIASAKEHVKKAKKGEVRAEDEDEDEDGEVAQKKKESPEEAEAKRNAELARAEAGVAKRKVKELRRQAKALKDAAGKL